MTSPVTPTTTVLARALVREGRRVAAGASPLGRNAASEKGPWRVTETLLKGAKEVETRSRLRPPQISAGGRDPAGDPDRRAMDKVLQRGVITVEVNTFGTLELTEGMRFDKATSRGYFVTTRSVRRRSGGTPSCWSAQGNPVRICHLLEVIGASKPLLIIAEDVEAALSIGGGQGSRLRRPPQGDAAEIWPFSPVVR